MMTFRYFLFLATGLVLTLNVSESFAAQATTPAAPSQLTGSAASPSQIILKFQDNSSNEQGFAIKRSLSSSSGFSQIATLASNVTTFSDTGLSASTTYYYRVAAFRKVKGKAIYSADSNLISIATLSAEAPPPPPPSPASCSFNGQTIVSGGSVTAYQASSVPSGSSCLSETRICNNGILSGSYLYSSCSVQAAPTPLPPPITSEAGLGWTEIPNSVLLNVTPANAMTTLHGGTGPTAIVNAWGGGMADTKRNRLVIWGGGHNDYYGNEVYALDVGAGKMLRLTEPSPVDALWSNPNDPLNCPELYSDGGPVSRHTYGALAYMPSIDSMYAFSGSRATCGYGSRYGWTIDFLNLKWQLKDPSFRPPGGYGIVSDYDPNSGLVFITALSDAGVYSYNPATSSYTKHSSSASMDYHMNGVIDPSRKKMILFGPKIASGGIKVIDLTAGGSYAMTDITAQTQGCEGLMTESPGLAFDSSQNVIVGWPNKGSTVYIFNPDTKTCTAKTFTNGPSDTDTGSQWGTFGRFRYFPALDAFALVYSASKNAFLLKLK